MKDFKINQKEEVNNKIYWFRWWGWGKNTRKKV